jgi:hypothetical protein
VPDDPNTTGDKKPRRRRKLDPRPEEQQAPEPEPSLTAKERENIDKVAFDTLFLTREEQACVHLSMEESREKAAVRLGWTLAQVMGCLAQPHVKLYAIEYRAVFMNVLARRRAASLLKVGVTRSSVQERLMDIAMMDPDRTKGSVDGQVKALTQLANILGMTKDDPLKDKTDEELMNIVNGVREKTSGTKPN